MSDMTGDWQPARIVWVCGKGQPDSVEEQVERAEHMIVRVRPSSLGPCDFCGGKAFTIHPADAELICPDAAQEIYACEKDILTD